MAKNIPVQKWGKLKFSLKLVFEIGKQTLECHWTDVVRIRLLKCYYHIVGFALKIRFIEIHSLKKENKIHESDQNQIFNMILNNDGKLISIIDYFC